MWMQRSRVAWLREGDRNTKYFHRQATWHCKKNKISGLKRADGSWTENEEETGHMATEFFQKLYTQEDNTDPSELLELFSVRVDEEMNTKLCAPFSERRLARHCSRSARLRTLGLTDFRPVFCSAIGIF